MKAGLNERSGICRGGKLAHEFTEEGLDAGWAVANDGHANKRYTMDSAVDRFFPEPMEPLSAAWRIADANDERKAELRLRSFSIVRVQLAIDSK